MNTCVGDLVMGAPLSSLRMQLLRDKAELTNNITSNVDKRASSTLKIRKHGGFGTKIIEVLKRNLILGMKIIRFGWMTTVFKQNSSVEEGEKLVRVCRCCISTTAGPIPGRLFISNDNVAFCSKKSINISSPTGELIKIQYKVLIPLRKIQRATESVNVDRPSKKYIEIVTVDKFDFWFMGFQNHQTTFNYLQEAIYQAC